MTEDSSQKMIWTANFICLLNLVQASLPSLAEIISRKRLCLGENAHCPVNIYENFDLCCKPLVCTVVPKTCKPNFINRYFNISDYKDYRCMFPSKSNLSAESTIEGITLVPFESPSMKNDFAITTSNEFIISDNRSGTNFSKENNMTEINVLGDSFYNETIYRELNQSNSSNETEYESEGENIDKSPSIESFHGSLLDSQSFIDSNEIRRLAKRYVSNDSSSDNSLSISSILHEGRNNYTFEQEHSFSSSSSKSENGSVSPQTQTDASQGYSGSSSVSESGEVYDYESNETKTGRANGQHYSSDSKQRSSEGLFSTKSTNGSVIVISVEDWHSSDMKYDSRPNVFKVITVQPWRWIQTNAQVVKLNLSSEISE